MAGHMITCYLQEQGEDVVGVARRELSFCKTCVLDVTEFDELKKVIEDGEYDIIINCVGLLNQVAENNPARAVLINAFLPHYLAEITRETDTKVIHMSTDCVFSGKTGQYIESDFPDGESMYARSKALGELNDSKNLTFRNSIVGPDINKDGIGLFNWFMKQTGQISGYEKSIWTGVTTLTLAKAMHKASYTKLTGIYNLVNNATINKYHLLCMFNAVTEKKLLINPVAGVAHDKSLLNTRSDFDFVVPSYQVQIEEMVEWINNHKDMYIHYFEK